MHKIRRIATDVARSVVCVSVGYTYVLCKNGSTDQDVVWTADSCWLK